MKFTDIFIKRPVLASVVSLLILVVGIGSIAKLQLRQYPKMDNTTITVTTAYPGANARLVQGFITTPLEQAIGSADGINYMTATSAQDLSTIVVHVKLNYPPDNALTEVTGKVNSVLDQLPEGSKSPTITKATGETMPALILGFTSKSMTPEQITAYLNNVVSPEIFSVGGISQVMIMGAQQYAMRIWLNAKKMAQLGVTPDEVQQALLNNNVQSTAGQLKTKYLYLNLDADTNLHTAAQFNNLVVKNDHGHLIRLKDVGKAELGSESYNSSVLFNGKQAVFTGIETSPGSNPLTVIGNVIKHLPSVQSKFPPGLKMKVVYNSTTYISTAIEEVIQTIVEATIIVMIVIFLFLGALRSVMVPVVTIPLSLIGVTFLMFLMGFSINLLTLLAMVLAIGMVVDDAIVVMENIYRHLEEGLTPFQSAIKGAREITGPIVVMTTTLAAVFAPIGFLGGITGALFKEFAFTLAAAVIISGIIALTFSPMMCSKIITRDLMDVSFVKRVDRFLNKLKEVYRRRLTASMSYRPFILFMAIVVLASCFFMVTGTKKELAPMEDQGFVIVYGIAPSAANIHYLERYDHTLEKIFHEFPQMHDSFLVNGFNANNILFGGMILKPWNQRKLTQMKLVPMIQKKLAQVPGLLLQANQVPPLPGVAFGPPVQFVVTTTQSHKALFNVVNKLAAQAKKSGLFIYVANNLRYDNPQINIKINRSKAADMGITMQQISTALNVMIGDNLVNYFDKQGYSYEVIPQVTDGLRNDLKQLRNIHIKTSSGKLVPLSTIVTFQQATQPSSLNQFQQLNSATLEAVPIPGVTMGQALTYLQNTAHHLLPRNMSYDYSGQSRQYEQEGNAMMYAFIFALIVIFLVLSAQFESFRDPFIVLISVPMSICGALIPLYLGFATLNIYTEIGLITLIGLISKHGILMVEFANKLQEQGMPVREAIIEAASIRLRPILMTTFAMIFGVVPLILATGAGAVSRFNVGLVIAMGMAIGTCFTLFVVPTMYTFIAKDRRKYVAVKASEEQQIQQMEGSGTEKTKPQDRK